MATGSCSCGSVPTVTDLHLQLLLQSSSNERHRRDISTSRCDLIRVLSNIKTCDLLPFGSTPTADVLDRHCNNVECNLKCFMDAVGDCYKQDSLIAWEPKPTIVFGRGICANKSMSYSLLNDCFSNFVLDSCWRTFANDLSNIIPLVTAGMSSAYKTKYCSAVSTLHLCIDFPISSKCTKEVSEFGKALFTAGTSFSACGFTQDHSLFTNYNDTIACGANFGGNDGTAHTDDITTVPVHPEHSNSTQGSNSTDTSDINDANTDRNEALHFSVSIMMIVFLSIFAIML